MSSSDPSLVKQALLRIEQLERENARLRQAEPIAILGMACRFPGGVDSPGALWELLLAGGDAVSEVPAGRWPLARFYDADPDAPGKTYSRHGGFLGGPIDLFDAAFFGISPLEARALDPQQRLLLEVSWEALENAGLPVERLRGSRTGVFVGIAGSDYLQAQLRGGPERIGPYDATGAIGSTAVGRIAYTFDFRGPALAVDTACSSSLVALDQASASLRQGSSDLALAGGVNLILGPEGSICFARMKALSASGRCRTFDAAADGFVRSEGCGVVVLKRLADARRAGDPVLAVLRGSAVNQDGRSNGLTAPNLLAQREVIRQALEQAGAGPLDVSYVEAHGTGTPLGDPIEVEALADVLCAGRREPLLLGSVKTNLGHLEAAAGMAGLFKVVLALQHGEIPPNLHFLRPSPHIPWAELPIRVPVHRTAWTAGDRPRLAGLSSFGFGGTNGHVVIAEAPPLEPPAAEPGSRPSHYLLCLSAKSEPALGRLADAYAGVLAKEPDADPGDLCAGANAGRSHFRHRLAVVGTSPAELRQRLAAGVTGAGADPARGAPPVVFLFTGQGSQYPGMGRELYRSEPRFRSVLERCNDLLEPRLGRSLVDLLDPEQPGAALLSEASYLQPALFAVEYALARLWQAWGVEPAAMAGHSVGEIVAACLAGVFSLEDALALVTERGRLVDSLPRRGSMATVFAGENRVAEELASLGHGADGDLVIAAVNGPAQVVVAGVDEAVEAALAHFRERGLRVRPLAATHAFHSPLLDPILPAFERAAAVLQYSQPSVPVVSNLTGEGGADMANARYWVEHLRRPVRFADSLAWLLGQGYRTFLEIGPAATLTALGKQVSPEATWLASLRKGQPDRRQMLSSAAELYVRGVDFDWPELGRPRRFPTLPNYPFERQSYWFEGGEMGLQGENMSDTESRGNVPSARREAILTRLKQVVADSSGLAQPGIDIHLNLLEMGLDSLMLMQVRQEIGRSYGVEIPVSEFFQGLETLDKLAGYLAEQAPAQREQALPVASPAPAMPQTPTPPTPLLTGHTPLERLMEQQLQALSQLVAQQLDAFRGTTAGPVQALAAPGAVAAVDAVAVPPASGAPETFVPYRRINTAAETLTDERKRAHLGRLVARYTEATGPSKERTQADRPVFANNRNIAGFRPAWKEMIYQIIAERAQGSRIWAVGGREYIDLTMGFGVHLFGHQPPFLTAAIEREMRQGMPLGPMSHLAGRVAREICAMTGVERVAFYNTGTEAVMVALRIARTVTGRAKVVLFEGSYHGGFDGVLAAPRHRDGVLSTVPGSPGTTQGMVDDVLVLKYGDPESLARIRACGHELAAVLVEPVQSRRPDLRPREFLSELRRITAEHGAALIFDEMVLGFRLEPGGAQAYFDIRADLVTYGKVIGGGMPIGIVAGRADFMDAVDGGMWSFGDDSYPRKRNTFVAGTFCHHPLSLAAALAVLEHLRAAGPSLQAELNRTTARFCQRLNDFFGAEQVPIRVEPCGSLFRFFLRGDLDLLFYHLIEKGIYIWEGRNCFLSTAHTEEDLEQVYRAVVESIGEMRRGGYIAELSAELPAERPLALAAAPAIPAPASAGSGRTMEFSLFYFSSADGAGQDKYRLLLAGARYADRHGFTAIWTPERHFHDFGGLYPNPSITSAALATITERIRIRAGSTVLLLHNPVRFAENWSMVDNLSGGRVDLAVALGWNSNDFFFAPETFEKRSDLLPERLEMVRRLWRGETLTGKGGRGEEVRVQLHPKPVQPDLAIWFPASGNPETFVHAGESGVNVLTYLEGQTVEELGQKIALYRQARREHGHEPHGHVTLMLHTLVGEDEGAVLQMARPPLKTYLMSSFFLRSQLVSSLGMDLNGIQPKDLDVLLDRAIDRYLADRALIGTPDSCVAMIERLRAIGVDEVGCLIDFGIDFEPAMAGLALLGQVRERCQARSVPASPDRLPLSAGQRELWAFVQTSPEASLAYNESVLLRLAGPLDRAALQSAVESLIERHQALRMVEPDGTSQKVLAHLPAPLLLTDLCDVGDRGQIDDWLERESRRRFDLEAGPLFRLHVARTAEDDHLLLLTAHHLIANGWSIGILLEELAALYSAARLGTAYALPEPVPFSAYLEWQRERAARQDRHAPYWREKLAAPWPALALPADFPLPARPRYAGARRELRIEGELYLALRELAAKQGVTLFMCLLAAFKALLLRWSGQERVTVGVALAEQAAMGAERLVGHCSSLLPACTDAAGAETFAELLGRVRRTLLEIYDHQEVSLSALAAAEPPPPPPHLPAIEAMFNMDRAPVLPAFAGLETSLLPAPVSSVKFDLSLNVLEVEDGLVLDFDYKTGLFEAATVERWVGFFGNALQNLAADPSILLCNLLREPVEEEPTVSLWIGAGPAESLLGAWARQVESQPAAPALEAGGEVLSYADLDRRAKQLGCRFWDLGQVAGVDVEDVSLATSTDPDRWLAEQARALRDHLLLGAEDRIVELGKPSLDLLLAALTSGASFRIGDSTAIEREIGEASVLSLPVERWREARRFLPPAGRLRHVLLSGSPLLYAELQPWPEGVTLHHVHRPAGLPLVAALQEIEAEGEAGLRPVPVGRPLRSSVLLDWRQQPVPAGAVGEWWIESDGPGGLFPTGDLARVVADGAYLVLGPAAERIRIDGRPVDPGQVEAVLRTLVDDAVVVVETPPAGDPRLLASVVLPAGWSLGELRRHLGEMVPPWLVPASFVQAGEEDRDDPVPASETEERLVRAWEEVLGRQGIGIHDDFYQLGGNSLKAVRLAHRIERELGIEVGLKELLESPTIHRLARRLARHLESGGSAGQAPIPRLAEDGPYPLSHAQKRLWVLHQRERDSAAYNVTASAWLSGPLDRAAFHRAFAAVLARHESLRTRVIEWQGEPLQEVCPPEVLGPVLEEVDLSREEGPELLVQAIARDESVRPFDLTRGPLLRAKLLRLAEDRHALLLTLHHIVSDGWSLEVMMRDAGSFYRAFVTGAEAGLPPLSLQYRDYAAWQSTRLAADRAGRDFWRRTFAGGPPVLDLPTDFPRPPVQTWNGSALRFELAADVVADLRRLGEESRASLFSVLLAAVSVLLHQATGQRDLVVGTPFAGRSHPDLEDQVGLYVNTLALRNRLREDEPFADLLERVRKNATEAFENAEYPLDLVVADLDRKRDWSRSPLFDVLLMLEDDRRSEPWGSLALSPFEIDPEVSLFDLSFHFTAREAGLDLALLWNRDLFKPERMRALYDRLTHLLRDLAAHPGKPIAALGREEGRDRARRGIQLVGGFNL